MRFSFASARADPWDRNPTFNASQVSQTFGNHAETTRTTYTVPSAKKAFIMAISLYIARIAADGALGQPFSQFKVDNLPRLQVTFYSNTVGISDRSEVGYSGTLIAGQVITTTTSNNGTAPTNIYYGQFWQVLEFDS